VELKDLPEVWNQKMWDYLGVEVPDDAHGVLQDVHWSGGMIGYFSTYLLGTVMSVQIWEAVLRDVPDLSEQVGRGEFATLREWLASIPEDERGECWWLVIADGTPVAGNKGGGVAMLAVFPLTGPLASVLRVLRLSPLVDWADEVLSGQRGRLGKVVPEGPAP